LRKALLVVYPEQYIIEEAKALAEAAGYEPANVISQKYLERAKFGIGSGKAEEAAKVVRENHLDAVVFDARLSGSQTYNLAKLCKVEVKDREKVILEIFAKRASTAEAKLQVQLAELTYELPRAKDKVRMAKKGEQPGFFGLGKYEVDVYVRMMKDRVGTLRRKVDEVRNRRVIFRQHRERMRLPSMAITGYTGSGKTTLFNHLSGESKDVDAGAFTTLSPTTRGIMVDHTKLLISDTVGFISRLPTYMIEAFKSTLEEVAYANFVLLLVDASEPEEKLVRNFESCTLTLSELGVPEGRTLVVMNKADLLTGEQLGEKAWRLGLKDPVAISAKTGAGFGRLMGAIEERLGASRQVPAPDGRVNAPA
jgi:GTP-binding protein HflX